MRTRTRVPAGQAWKAKERCISIQAAAQALAEENTAKKPFPCVLISLPSCAASAARIISWCSDKVSAYTPSPKRVSRAVDPSMSVNRKVSVSVARA